MKQIEYCTAVVLTGGESRRMGSDKAGAVMAGKSLLQHVLEPLEPLFADIAISVRELRDDVRWPQIVDRSAERGPMVGVMAALMQAPSPWIFVIGCDMPFVSIPLIRILADMRGHHDAVVMHAHDRPQPLFGFYTKSCLPVMQKRMTLGERSMIRLLKKLDTCLLTEQQAKEIDPQLRSLISLDTAEDVKRMEPIDE